MPQNKTPAQQQARLQPTTAPAHKSLITTQRHFACKYELILASGAAFFCANSTFTRSTP